MTHTISFPGLGIKGVEVPTSFRFFGFTIHYYGVIIALGIILAYFFAKKKAQKRDISNDTILDVIIWGLPSAVICARIYYVAFSWQDYRHSLIDVFKIWEGGIAIYGAVIGACVSTLIYCRIKKVPVLKMFDVGAFGLLIGQIIGRWGNFVNAEAYGKQTQTALFRMTIYMEKSITVHPTFLYESAWNLLVFIVINLCEKYQKFNGEIFLWYITGYGFGRFFIEDMRADSLMLGHVRVSMVLAGVCFLVGAVLIIYGRVKHKNKLTA